MTFLKYGLIISLFFISQTRTQLKWTAVKTYELLTGNERNNDTMTAFNYAMDWDNIMLEII